jgi:hypothetical protein
MLAGYQIEYPSLPIDPFSHIIRNIFPEFNIDVVTEGLSSEGDSIRIRMVDNHTDLNRDLQALVCAVDPSKFHIYISSAGRHL